ncbi:uncharacterized protein N7500_001645 [Penicillium coprophilum]|uniref:uncharacterized protein n=1 Tax=Penicillium coprophilum TaxID=36646 RepID=UPI0023926D3E|nr:uncharacterized protein N7500_001645 [Penicillium coprophilum]KAJ5173714.1 hypothetical protein N7500_001645 [Penicillium coprophilum]
MDDSMPREEIIGVVIGAVALFSLISMIPVPDSLGSPASCMRNVLEALTCRSLIYDFLLSMIMWHHRRRAAIQAMGQTTVLPPIYQVQLQNVLGQPVSGQPVSVDRWLAEQNVPTSAQQYGQDTCPICLSALSSSPYLACPDPSVLAHDQYHNPTARPDAFCICGAKHSPPGSEVLVLNRCKHAFHLDCLKSWFEYRRYKCPICQASYSPEEEARG